MYIIKLREFSCINKQYKHCCEAIRHQKVNNTYCIDENQRLISSLLKNVNMPVILHSVGGYVCEVGDRGQCIHPFNFWRLIQIFGWVSTSNKKVLCLNLINLFLDGFFHTPFCPNYPSFLKIINSWWNFFYLQGIQGSKLSR